ncbi:MAG: hypothetical protein OER95_13380, partial [Acidimicrobiia bacterium]|nr:hypothetical protein [Acidimicrobiia bacterium]
GRSSQSGSTAGPTARGVFNGMRASAEAAFGRSDLAGLRVAVQGVGGVGSELARLLVEAGAEVTVADVDADAVAALAHRLPSVSVVTPDEILAADVDVVSPNAIGGVLDKTTIPTIRATVVCGSANNQLATSDDGASMTERGILWAPDYVVSAGGAIAGTCEVGAITETERDARLEAIYHTTLSVLEQATTEGVSSDLVAQRMAREILDSEG